MNEFWASVTSVAAAIIGVAIIAVLVSNNAQTANVIQSATTGFANDLTAAVSPVTGNSATPNVGNSGFGGFTGQGGAGLFQRG